MKRSFPVTPIPSLFVCALLFVALPFPARAQDTLTETKLTPSGPGLSNVAIDGDFIASAPGGTWDQNSSIGIFRKIGSRWQDGASETILRLTGVTFECCFGWSLALQIPYLFVSTGARSQPEGQVHVFKFDGQSWAATQKLPIPNAWDNDSVPIAVHGDVLVAGSRHEAYVFRYNDGEWQSEARLDEPSPGEGNFGADGLAVVGDVVVVGTEFPDGSAHVFHHTLGQWQHVRRLDYPGHETTGGSFGRRVQMNESWLAIGAPEDEEGGSTAGAIFIYEDAGEGYSLVQKITSPFPANQGGHNGASMGDKMAMSGDLIANIPYGGEMGVLLYRRDTNGWIPLPTLTPIDPSVTAFWGSNQPALDLVQSALVVADPSGNALYVYENLPGVSVGVEDRHAAVARESQLNQNFPNPFNPTTTITYDLARLSKATLTVYDVLGRQVIVLASGTQAAGHFEVSFDAARLPNGIYFYRLEAGDFVETKRMVVVR